jgi:hypothetical protein
MRSLAALVAPIPAAWGNIDCVGQNWLHGSISLAAWVDTSKLWFLSVTSATVQLWTLTANSAIDTLWAAAASPASGCQNLGRAEAADSLRDHQTLGVGCKRGATRKNGSDLPDAITMGGAGSAFRGNATSQGDSTGAVGSRATGNTGSGLPNAGSRAAAVGPCSGPIEAVIGSVGSANHGCVG